ncbi:hypothetical protein Tdes44962_MAKER09585 [Teratosphaeria destructans]|uniref:Uncharacterized protein n=1 Tax=Teratosphaeria destructans TaxID=418781 RepID=A0A9W7W2Y5_9PEZI|nr:hypothetical protein Tdes44962_MAKER09585 [Teratosphaeria destructans]
MALLSSQIGADRQNSPAPRAGRTDRQRRSTGDGLNAAVATANDHATDPTPTRPRIAGSVQRPGADWARDGPWSCTGPQTIDLASGGVPATFPDAG